MRCYLIVTGRITRYLFNARNVRGEKNLPVAKQLLKMIKGKLGGGDKKPIICYRLYKCCRGPLGFEESHLQTIIANDIIQCIT